MLNHLQLKQWANLGFLLLVLVAICATSCAGGGAQPTMNGTGEAPTSVVGANANLEPPPAPPTYNAPQPGAVVTVPNLRVLPWAGFKAAITYTFDDSQPSQIEHWSELQATGVPMTFFVNPSGNWQAGYDAAWTAVAAAGSEPGNHTWSHCYSTLADCTAIGTQAEEIDQTTTYITTHLGVNAVYSFAAPFGDAGWNVYAAPHFLLGRGVMSGSIPASGQADWYNLPVFSVTAGQTATDFDAAIDKTRSLGRWCIFMFHSILPTTSNWYAGVQISDITANIAYGKSLGDVWIDTMINVGSYARAQQMFEGLTPNGNTWTWTLPAHFPPGKVLRVTVDGGTLSQGGTPLVWDSHGYYQVALDAGTLTWRP